MPLALWHRNTGLALCCAATCSDRCQHGGTTGGADCSSSLIVMIYHTVEDYQETSKRNNNKEQEEPFKEKKKFPRKEGTYQGGRKLVLQLAAWVQARCLRSSSMRQPSSSGATSGHATAQQPKRNKAHVM